MVDSNRRSVELRTTLRRRISRLLRKDSTDYRGLRDITDAIRSRGWRAFVFGGVARDLLASHHLPTFRDVDIVVMDVQSEDLASVFDGAVRRLTRFGGLHLHSSGWEFDIWPLEQTWAFQHNLFQCIDPQVLVQTTFLNTEAAAVDLFVEPGHARQVYEHGFFRAFNERLLDINLEENPYPKLCVVRSMVAAARLRFAISKRLVHYIAHHSGSTSLEELEDVQRRHYGRLVLHRDEICKWLNVIRAAENADVDRIELPVPVWRQLELWDQGRQSPSPSTFTSTAHKLFP